MKKQWKIVIAAAVVLALLAGAFWLGGGSPASRGWTVNDNDASAAAPETEPPVAAPEASTPAESVPAPTADPDPAPAAEEPTAGAPTAAAEPEPEVETPPAPAAEPDAPAAPEPPQSETPAHPEPVDPAALVATDTARSCTISIRCATILDHPDWLDADKAELVPEDGWLLAPVSVTFYEGESVFNLLQRTCKQYGIHMEFTTTPLYNSAYIEGIGNLYEFDCGELSGWMYSVNGWFPNYGCSRYALSDGDEICWVYTCDLGDDVGGGYAGGQQAD